MKWRGINFLHTIILLIIFCYPFVHSYGYQATSGATGYALLPSISCLKKGEVLFSTWGSYITSKEFKGTGIFPLNFATGIIKRVEGFLTFSGISGFTDFDTGITAGLKWNIYNTNNNVYPSAGILIESYSMETSPDARISLILERSLPWKFKIILTGGYANGRRDRIGATGGAGLVYGNDSLRVVIGTKSLSNGDVNTLYISGIFNVMEQLFLNIISGRTFSDRNINFISAGFTFATLREKIITPVEAAPPVQIIKPPEKKRFPSPVPEFRLRLK